MTDQRRHIEFSGEDHGRLLAGLLRDALCPALFHPAARDHEVGERLGQFDHQRVPDRGREVGPGKQRFADRREVAEALHDAREREFRDVGADILDQRQARFRRSDFRDRGRDRARQHLAARDRALHQRAADRDGIDQIGVEQKRRALQYECCDIRLIGDQRVHHRGRRIGARAERVRERKADQRRRIVEQQDHRAFGGGAIVRRKIGVEIGAGECAGCFRALRGFRGTDPLQELTNNHDQPTQQAASRAAIASG